MTRMLIRLFLAVMLAGAGLPACAEAAASDKAALQDQDAANSRLLAAAEPFETMTEQAFTARPVNLEKLINQADQAARQVSSNLPPDAQGGLGKRLAEIKQAQKANNRSEIALASVEGYRILVSAAHPTKVPTAVNLLDYAGFRYDADLKSKPARWADMRSAAQFAQDQWDTISGQVSDAGLRSSFAAVLNRMSRAAVSTSADDARNAVKTELAFVDRLETYFNQK